MFHRHARSYTFQFRRAHNQILFQNIFSQALELLLQKMKEEGETHWVHTKKGTSTDMGGLKDGVESLIEGIKQLTEKIASVKEKMREGFIDVKEELGSMMRFSYADLEKRFNALEARIKALEKMVFP